jgi:hypothetical protein
MVKVRPVAKVVIAISPHTMSIFHLLSRNEYIGISTVPAAAVLLFAAHLRQHIRLCITVVN